MDGFVYSFRLGLGAKFVPHSKINATVTPIEKKLRAKLQISKTSKDVIPCKARKGIDKSGEANVEQDVSEEEEDSKSSLFNNSLFQISNRNEMSINRYRVVIFSTFKLIIHSHIFFLLKDTRLCTQTKEEERKGKEDDI